MRLLRISARMLMSSWLIDCWLLPPMVSAGHDIGSILPATLTRKEYSLPTRCGRGRISIVIMSSVH